MSKPSSTGLNRARKFLLAVAGVAALAGQVVIGTMIGIGHSPAIWAQTPAPNSPEFAAASIKSAPCAGSRCGGADGTERLKFTPGRGIQYAGRYYGERDHFRGVSLGTVSTPKRTELARLR
jgi:hypothetical protein